MCIEICCGVMLGGAVVPDCDVTRCPAPTHGVFNLGDVGLEDLDDLVCIKGRQACQPFDEMSQDKCFFARLRMDANHGMFGFIDLGDESCSEFSNFVLVGVEFIIIGVVIVPVDGPQGVCKQLQRL